MGIIYPAFHIDAVSYNMQMGDSRAAVAVESYYILTAGKVCPCRAFAVCPTGQIDRIELLHKIICQPLPVVVRPSLGFVPGWGYLDTDSIILQWAMTAQFRLELFLVNDHPLPDAFGGNIVGQEIQLDDFRFVFLCGIADSICAV